MKFNRYLLEADLAATTPAVGDQFNIVVNESVNIQTTVVESADGKVTLKLDDKSKSMLENLGVVFEAVPSSHTYVANRDIQIVGEYNGYAMGDESIDDDDGFTKYGYGVYKFVKNMPYEHGGKVYTQKHYRRIGDVLDPATDKSPSPYYKGNWTKAFQYTVDKLNNSNLARLGEGEDSNFTADDIKNLEGIRDLDTLKAKALELISTQSKRAMKPNKVAWFKKTLPSKKSVPEVIKLMYDLMLSGEGHTVIGSRYSTKPNSYRTTFGEGEMNDMQKLAGISEKKEVWDKPNPKQVAGTSKKLSDKNKNRAKARAKAAGRPYPNMVDNIWAARNEDTDMSNLRRLSGLGEAKTRRYVVVHLPNGQTTKRQFTIDASSDEEAKSIAATRMKDRPNSKLISIKHNKPLMHKPNLVDESMHEATGNEKLANIAMIIQDAVANAFPDGDPIDSIIPQMRSLGIDSYEIGDWLDKAAREELGSSSYNNYLQLVWQDFIDDNPGEYGLTDNPWNESLDEDSEFIIGDRIRHRENGRVGRIVGDPWGNEYPVEYDDEKGESYYVDAPTLTLVESQQLKLFALTENSKEQMNFGKLTVDVAKSNVSGSVVLHQIAESATGKSWTAKVTATKSAIAEFIRR